MALVQNEFSTFRLSVAFRTVARFSAALTEAAKRFSESRLLTFINDLSSRWSLQSYSGPLPGSVFDTRYKGLSAHAAHLDAAICRQTRVR
jgi:hypothetical protein